MEKKANWFKRHWILSIIIGFIFIIAVVASNSTDKEREAIIASGGNPDAIALEKKLEDTKEYQARMYADYLIRNNVPLKSPSTADYERPKYANRTATNTYEVYSYVDSQNGFGAMIRSEWAVMLQYVGEDKLEQINYIDFPKNWKVIEAVFDGKKVI